MGLTSITGLMGGALPVTEIDANFQAVGLLGAIPCAASGASAITLTPLSSVPTPTVSAYQQYGLFSFVAPSSGLVTLGVGNLPFLNVYNPDGVTRAVLAAATQYFVSYDGGLNNGAGGWRAVLIGAALLPANNLSDLVNAPAARANIGLGNLFVPPQGRVTLTSATPITTTDVIGATSVYYTPAAGNLVPLFDSTTVNLKTFPELSLALDPNSGDTGYHQTGKGFYLFVANNSGTLVLGTGPAWTSDTTPGAGAGTTELQFSNGLWSNKNSMTLRFGSAPANTLTVPAGQATAIGAFYTTANGQTEDSYAKRLVFNFYNQSSRPLHKTDPAVSWSYNTAAFRQADGNIANQVEVFFGLAGVGAHLVALGATTNTVVSAITSLVGIGINSTTANSAFLTGDGVANGAIGTLTAEYDDFPGIGHQTFAWLEYGNGSGTQTWFGTNGGANVVRPGLSGGVVI